MSRRTLGEATSNEEQKASLLAAPWPYFVAGAIILGIGLWLVIGGSAESARAGDAREQARTLTGQLARSTEAMREALRSESVQEEAERVLAGAADPSVLLGALQSRVPGVVRAEVLGPDVFMAPLDELGEPGFVKLDMLADANVDETSPVQILVMDGERYLAAASTIGRAVQEKGFVLAYAEPDGLWASVTVTDPASGYLGVEMKTGGNAPVTLREFGGAFPGGYSSQRLSVAGSLFQVVFPAYQSGSAVGPAQRWSLIVIGFGLLALGVVRLRQARKEVPEVEPVPDHFVTMTQTGLDQRTLPPTLKDAREQTRRLPRAERRPSGEGQPKTLPPSNGASAGETGPRAPDWDAPEPAAPEPKRPEPPAFGSPESETAAPKAPTFGAPDTDAPPLFGRISEPAKMDSEDALGAVMNEPQATPDPDHDVPDASPLTGMPMIEDDDTPDIAAAPDAEPSMAAPEAAAPAPEAAEPAPAPEPPAPAPAPPTPGVRLKSHIFRAYDIRGIVGESLDRGIAFQIGQAVGSLAQESLATPVVIGRDGRHSGPELVEGLRDGLRASGCDVIDIGAVPTGVLYFAANEFGKGSGVMVTGSHNPPDYNGFKIMIGGRTLAGDDIFGLFERIRMDSLLHGDGQLTERDALTAYRERIAGDIQLKRPLKVVADCGNGIGGVCATEVLQAIGAEVIPLFEEVDGDFPNHHPDPSEPENLEDLIEQLRVTKADLGIAFDGDADRLGVVTPDGNVVFSDRIMMLYAREVLGRNPGARIIYDVKCTGHLDTVIREAGGEPEMYKTGHSLMKNRMRDVGAPLAGEMSGHFFFKDRWYGFDCGIYSACRLLEILAMEDSTPQEVLGALPDSVSTPELKVQLEEGENHAFIEAFKQQAKFPGARINVIDGVRADFADGWGLVRASNTTPILVLRFDADSERSLHNVKEAFRAQLLAVRSDLDLPF